MRLPSLVDLDTLEERLGQTLEPDSLDGKRAQAALEDASTLVRQAASYNWANSDGDLIYPIPDAITLVVTAAAYRAFKNPNGAAQASVGDVSITYAGRADSAVFLTKAEHRAVRKAAGRAAVGTIELESDLWAEDVDLPAPTAGDPIPIGPLPWE